MLKSLRATVRVIMTIMKIVTTMMGTTETMGELADKDNTMMMNTTQSKIYNIYICCHATFK